MEQSKTSEQAFEWLIERSFVCSTVEDHKETIINNVLTGKVKVS